MAYWHWSHLSHPLPLSADPRGHEPYVDSVPDHYVGYQDPLYHSANVPAYKQLDYPTFDHRNRRNPHPPSPAEGTYSSELYDDLPRRSSQVNDHGAHFTRAKRPRLRRQPSENGHSLVIPEKDRSNRIPRNKSKSLHRRHTSNYHESPGENSDESDWEHDFALLSISDNNESSNARSSSRPTTQSLTIRPKHRPSRHDPTDLDIKGNCASKFCYPPIDFGRQQIRLVRIIPSRGSSPIRCEFVLSMVDNHKKPYTALSYIWGPARERSDVVKIQLHDQDFWIRRNLWDFLQRARMDRSLCAKLFWIDAICIDQAGNGSNGLLEKNHQVNMMAEIYSNAHEVICWLGEPMPDKYDKLRDLELYLAGATSAEEEHHALEGLNYIGNLEYWTRMWVVQEVALAKQIVFRCGKFRFHWDDLIELWEDFDYAFYELTRAVEKDRSVLHTSGHDYDAYASFTRRVRWGRSYSIMYWKINTSKRLTNNILDAVQYFHRQDCSNPLDKVYGLLGLVNHEVVSPDYNKSTEELFTDLVRYCLQNGKLVVDVTRHQQGSKQICDWQTCEFVGVLGNALSISTADIKDVLAFASGVHWAHIHPFSKNCIFGAGF